MSPYLIDTASLPNNTCSQPSNSQHRDSAAAAQVASNLRENGTAAPVPMPMAVCGMALRLPGGISTPSDFWEFLLSKGDARSRVPESRYNIAAFHSKSGKSHSIKTEYGYFLDESVDISALDASFFNMQKAEIDRADPQQRQLLEVTRECFDSAGEINYRGREVGCFIGSFGEDWIEAFAQDDQHHGLYRISGYDDFVLSNRISYEYDLRGPSMTIRAACASSLIALRQACLAIERGECDSAIVGGASLILGPGMTITMSEQGVLSPNGSCRTFDADADGYARAEAINAIYIKPLQDAIRDGNPIRAVIRSTSSNCDGKTPGLFLPSSESHEAMIRKAYSSAGLDVSRTAFVECHGTGTPMGDPLEVTAVANVFGDGGIHIGSVKPNVGHSEAASGITSLIKAVLALEHQTIPPNIKFEKPNPKIPFKSRRLTVPVEPTPWPQNRDHRISINSFGIGGSNAHVVLDSAESFLGPRSSGTRAAEGPHLLLFSANTADSLKLQITNYTHYLDNHPGSLGNVAYTLAARRAHLIHRSYAVVEPGSQLTPSAPTKPPSRNAAVVMIFTGQGAHWPQMGLELFQSQPTFRACIQNLDKVLQALPRPPNWLIEEELQKGSELSNLAQASYSQPLCTAIQIGLVDALAALHIRPSAVVGHSSGEMAAAYAAGKLTAREAIIAAYYRGVVSGQVTRPGAMAAIGMSWEETSQFLVDGVVIACENSPSSVTISGDRQPLEDVLTRIRNARPDVLARLLKIDRAYHSHHMKEVGHAYHNLTKSQVLGNGSNSSVLFFSSVTGKKIGSTDKVGSEYWQSNLESPVRFRTAVANLLNHDSSTRSKDRLVFMEIGPHSALAGPLRQTLAEASMNSPYISAMIRGKNCTETFLSAIGQLHLQNVTIDFNTLTNPEGTATVLGDLPPYSWQHDKSFWYETRLMKEWRNRRHPHHELLGLRARESTDNEPTWRSVLSLDHVPWIRDHNIRGDIIFPCAGYVGMVGEAARQLHLDSKHSDGIFHGFSLRHVVVSVALVLDENKTTEIITTLTRHRLTDSLESEWFDFTVSSHNGVSWIKHCAGQVRPRKQNESVECTSKVTSLTRQVNSAKWYDAIRRVGANYGPRFQGLVNVTSATDCMTASASTANTDIETSNYLIHPTAIDNFLQVFAVANCKGIGRASEKMTVPTYIEQIEVYGSSSSLTFGVSVTSTPRGLISGSGDGLGSEGQVVMRMNGVKLTPLEDDSQELEDPHAASRLEWQPDIDFLNLADFIQPNHEWESVSPTLTELTRLCAEETLHRLSNLHTTIPHMEKFHTWLGKLVELDKNRGKTGTGSSKRMAAIEAIVSQIAKTPQAPFGEAMMKVLDNVTAIFTGATDPLGILLPDDTLTKLYNVIAGDPGFIRNLGHNKPNLRVLEIGAGTGGTTNIMLRDLVHSQSGQMMYSKYAYTDISAGFFAAAKDRFKQYPNIEFATLDISKDPLEQGFVAGSYDLIVAANVLHATPSLHETLSNARKLLQPDGRLLMIELYNDCKAINYIMGVLPGWWLGDADERPEEPYVAPERWDMELKNAGLGRVDAAVLNAKEPFQQWAYYVARPALTSPAKREVALLFEEDTSNTARLFKTELARSGFSVKVGTLDNPTTGLDVIVLLDINKPFFDTLTESKFEEFKTFVSKAGDAGIFWLTRPSSIKCQDPRFAQTLGAARAIRSELGSAFATCEVDNVENSVPLVVEIFHKFQNRRQGSDTMSPDFEFAISDGQVNVGRFYPFSISRELVKLNQTKEGTKAQDLALSIGKFGQASSLKWTATSVPTVKGDEVKIDIHAVGMNFKDVLILMGIISTDTNGLGVEGAGIVREVGPEVDDLAVGDRVIFITTGCFSTSLVVTAKLCAKIPDSLSFEDAATMPCVFATVIASLIDIGRLREGQSVLIHSACGGVGLAALQISQMLGAEIYATVGNKEKVEYLMANYGIPRNRIFNSRDASFLTDVKRETKGRGVDLVLNSLSGELLHASWQCVAEFGMLVEIGKRDLIGHGKLAMDIFEANRAYSGFDLTLVTTARPKETKRLLNAIVDYYQQGHIQPIKPIKTFTADTIVECFLYMQKGQHIGKIVVSMALESSNPLAIVQAAKTFTPDSDATFLLVGGLGGLGKSISTWMVEHGATHLIYLSRSAGMSNADAMFKRELESQGCSITVIKGSVTHLPDVEAAVAAAKGSLKGILQMSMVLRDQAFPRMTYEEWTAAVIPKVQGTWNLHQATLSCPLDFFVCFSSVSGVIGQPGQANYAAGNTFLDAFVQYRRSRNLPASSIDIGAMEDAGYLAENKAIREKVLSTGAYMIREPHLLDALTIAMTPSDPEAAATAAVQSFTSHSQFVLGLRSTLPLSDPSNRSHWRNDRRMAIFHQENASNETGSKGNATNDELKNFLRDTAASPDILSQSSSATFLARQICLKLFDTLLRPVEDDEEIDTSLSLSDAGLDSLIAIEMRSWWKQTFGFDISVLEMLGMGSMNALGEHAAKGLAMKFQTAVNGESKEDGQDHGYVGKYARYLTEDALKAVMPEARMEGSNGEARGD